MQNNKENLKTMLDIDDDITELSIFTECAKFMICSILDNAESTTEKEIIVFNHKNIITMTHIAYDYINDIDETLEILKKKSENYIQKLRSCENGI